MGISAVYPGTFDPPTNGHIDIVRRSLEGAVSNNWSAAMACLDPGVVWEEMPSLGPDASTYNGIDELRQAIDSWIGMWSEYDAEIVRYADAGEDIVALLRERGHGLMVEGH